MTLNWFSMCMGDDNRVRKPLITTEENLHGVDDYELKIGKFAQDWNTTATLSSGAPETDGDPDDILANSMHLPVFSSRLQKALAAVEVASRDIQYLPVRVYQSTGQEVAGFAIANIVARVPALDPERTFMLDVDETEIDPLTARPKVTAVGKAALRADALIGHDIIRLIEFFPAIYVSGRFKDIFDKNRFTGATFRRLHVE